MVNQKYLTFLAKMESVASDEDRERINAVRGEYVKLTGTDNKYINFLGKLESVASDAEKVQINAVRGKYAMMEMCSTAEGQSIARKIAENDIKNNMFKLRCAAVNEAIDSGRFELIGKIKNMPKAQLESIVSKGTNILMEAEFGRYDADTDTLYRDESDEAAEREAKFNDPNYGKPDDPENPRYVPGTQYQSYKLPYAEDLGKKYSDNLYHEMFPLINTYEHLRYDDPRRAEYKQKIQNLQEKYDKYAKYIPSKEELVNIITEKFGPFDKFIGTHEIHVKVDFPYYGFDDLIKAMFFNAPLEFYRIGSNKCIAKYNNIFEFLGINPELPDDNQTL